MWKSMLPRFITRAAVFCIALLTLSCTQDGDGETPKPDENTNGTAVNDTFVQFDNRAGICPVLIYDSSQRTGLIAEAAQGALTDKLDFLSFPHGFTFYFSYTTFIDDVPLTYTPRSPLGVQTVRIDGGVTTTVTVPAFDTGLTLDVPMTNNAYIAIKNNSTSAFYLVKGIGIVKPENYEAAQSDTSYIVNSGEKSVYKLSLNENDSESTQNYKLNINGTYINFNTPTNTFTSGRIYNFTLNGQTATTLTLTLNDNKPITQANVSLSQGLNAGFSFTKWQDTKTAGDGETVPGDNTIEFYANSARLDGAYWDNPNGSSYSGQILESRYRTDLQAIVIITRRTETQDFGFQLGQETDGGALVLRTSQPPPPPRHPFFKQ
jgi:hypothetical protein